MELPREWPQIDADRLRDLSASLLERLRQQEKQLAERDTQLSVREEQLARNDEELKRKQLKIDQLTHEIATLNRWRYAKRSEQIDAVQRSLLDESIDADIEALSLEIEALLQKGPSAPKAQPRRAFRLLFRTGRSDTNLNALNVAAAANSSAKPGTRGCRRSSHPNGFAAMLILTP